MIIEIFTFVYKPIDLIGRHSNTASSCAGIQALSSELSSNSHRLDLLIRVNVNLRVAFETISRVLLCNFDCMRMHLTSHFLLRQRPALEMTCIIGALDVIGNGSLWGLRPRSQLARVVVVWIQVHDAVGIFILAAAWKGENYFVVTWQR